MANIVFLSKNPDHPARGYWDHSFLIDLLSEITHNQRVPIVIPGAYQAGMVDEINLEMALYSKVAVFITSDEEGKFPLHELNHEDMYIFVQYRHVTNNFPIGYSPLTRVVLKDIGVVPKIQDWFFSGQVTHEKREAMAQKLRTMPNGLLVETDGFAKGLEPWEYFYNLAASKAVFCPPGPFSPDSFRLYETLEAGSIPIVVEDPFFEQFFSDCPFPPLSGNYEHIEDVLEMITPELTNQVFAWWIRKKYLIKQDLVHVLEAKQPDTTVIIPTSPIPSHPDTRIIDETIKSVRHHLKAPIIVTIDGVRPEQEDKRDDYNKFIRKFLWKCNFEYENVTPILFSEHKHQSGMLREVMKKVDTPYLLYVEHDTPLDEKPINWKYLRASINSGKAHVIRFHFEDAIPEEHKYLMIGEPDDDLQRTVQWSQRPHLARTAFYKNILNFFSDNANCFIEDLVYGKLIEAWEDKGLEAWKQWKLWIYHPSGGIRRSLNLDGRENTQKFDDRQIW